MHTQPQPLSKKEKERLKLSLLIIYGLWNTFEQWCRVLLPFSQWQLRPRPGLFDTLVLNSIGNGSILLGSFMIAQMIDTIGGRKTAIISTIIVGFYQTFIGRLDDYYVFAGFQALLMFNHIPTIIEALIGQLIGENGDDKERTALMMRLTIPLSIAFAIGPYMAVQFLYFVSPTLMASQTACGIVHLLVLLPVIIFMLPEQSSSRSLKSSLSIGTYFDILRETNFLWSLLFVILVTGPYTAYDQVVRTLIASRMLSEPNDMAKLALLLGVATLLANLFILPRLQQRLGPQHLLELALVLLAISYAFLSQFTEFGYLMIGMPIQIIGVSIAVGQLSAQIMSAVPRSHMGKAAALNRIAQLAAATMTPLMTGYYIDTFETQLLCYVSLGVTICALPLVHVYGKFMQRHFVNLPTKHAYD